MLSTEQDRVQKYARIATRELNDLLKPNMYLEPEDRGELDNVAIHEEADEILWTFIEKTQPEIYRALNKVRSKVDFWYCSGPVFDGTVEEDNGED